MNPLRSVGARLSLALAVVVGAALAIVYVALVPTLERRLVSAKEDQVRAAARSLSLADRSEFADEDFLITTANGIGGRAVAFTTLSRAPLTLSVFADSLQGRSAADVSDDPIARRAVALGRLVVGTVQRGDLRYAEAAVPFGGDGRVVLLSTSLHDTLADVDLVERRLLLAGLIALAVSVTVGLAASSAFARRLKRLERAAERIASGDFSSPVVDPGRDEVGELARAFERMRGRLAQLDDARRAFIANASHELRTPLFSLGGFLELLEDEELGEETRREFLDEMRGQVERLTRLATDLLDLSRIDAGRLRIETEPVDLGQLARRLATEFQAVAQADGHLLEALVEEEVAASGDDERVAQIGRILVANALRHTPPGTSVRLRVCAPGELAVEDEGPGIPPADAERVFERFTRLDGARASGSGLGLAIARELAELMRGSIRLESVPGHTVFTLVLPLATAAPFPRENERSLMP